MFFCFTVDTNSLGLTHCSRGVSSYVGKEGAYKFTTDRILPLGKLPLRAVTMRNSIFWNVTPCFFETSVKLCRITWRRIPESNTIYYRVSLCSMELVNWHWTNHLEFLHESKSLNVRLVIWAYRSLEIKIQKNVRSSLRHIVRQWPGAWITASDWIRSETNTCLSGSLVAAVWRVLKMRGWRRPADMMGNCE